MEMYKNNALFWQKLDSIFISSKIIIDRPKGSNHPKFGHLIYPVDYGYLEDTLSSDGSQIDVFIGTEKAMNVGSLIVSADILKKDCEIKLLVGCTETEIQSILEFLNQTEFQKAIFLRRGDEMPEWASNN